MSIPVCQQIDKLKNECEHAYGSANSHTRRRHEDPDYVDENEWKFIHTFTDQTHKNYLLARHLKATSNGQWKTLQWLMQGDLDTVLDKRMAHKTSKTGAKIGKASECCDDSTKMDKSIFVPLTSYFGPERIEEFVTQKQGSQHLLDFAVKKMKDEKLDLDVHASDIKNVVTFPNNDPNRIKYGKEIADMLMKRDLDAVLDKRMAHKPSTKVDKSIFVPLTSYFGPERIEEFIAQKRESQHLLDFAVKKMKDGKLDINVHASDIKDVVTFPDNDPNRIKYRKKIADMLMKRGLGPTGLARIDDDIERVGRKRYELGLKRTGRVKRNTELVNRPTAGYLTSYQRNADKTQMKNFIKTINQFYASTVEPHPVDVDSIEELTQTLEEEFYRHFSNHRPSYGKLEQSKLRLSAVIRMLKTLPGYEAFESVLYHEPYDRNKPWTWMRTFPKRIPKEYLKRISENILNDMKKWKRQQKIIASTYSPGKRVIDVAKSKRVQKKHGRPNLKNRNQKEDIENDQDI